MAVQIKKVASLDEFKALTTAQQTAIVNAIAKDRDGGLSGNDLREKFGDWLTGPRRCKLLKAFGHGAVVAASYVEYQDDAKVAPLVGGAQRTGSRHAKFHGNGKAATSRRAEIVAAREADKLAKAAARIEKREAAKAAKAAKVA